MKDDFKAVVPSPSTPSRRATPQQQQQQQQHQGARRPSDQGRASPRVKAHATRDAAEPVTPTTPPPSTPGRPTDNNDGATSTTFITALLASKLTDGTARHQPSERRLPLRPPSPLEAADADRARATTLSSNSLLSTEAALAANYVGASALNKFWRMFHREEDVHNHTVTTGPRTETPPTTKPSARATTKPLVLPLLTTDRPRSARSTYLAAVRKLHLSPEPMGIVRRRAPDKGPSSSVGVTTSSVLSCSGGSSTQEINLSSYQMGDTYATAFSEGFAFVPGVESINLANNRIGDVVAARLVLNALQSPVASTLQTLNLSHNALGAHASRAVAELLKTSKTLTTLNLAHNQLKDRDIAVLCDALQKNQTIARVHLSENHFGIPGMVAIAKFLEENAKIEEVYLAWNNIRGLGALKIAEALKFHASLRALDLSWNALDSNDLLKPRAIITALADALANNKVLVHLDLSNNHLDMDDCTLLAKQLEANHSLIGLHMSGNCGVMNSRGFLIPKETQCKLMDQHKMYSIAVFEETMSESGTGSLPPHVAPLVDKFCWYCGLWSEHRFAWTPPPDELPSTNAANLGVKVHLSHDDWRGVDMDKRDDGSYSAYCILPPGKTEYYLTVSDKSTDPARISYHFIKDKRHVRLMHMQHNQPSEAATVGQLQWVNVLRNARREGRDPCNTLQPRSTGKMGNERTTKWDINRSVFSRRRRESVQRSFVDTDAFVQKACSADWKQCKVDRFVKDATRRKEVEASVAKHFRIISNIYRKYCGHNVLTSVAVVASVTPAAALQIQNDMISVPWSGYMEFLNECRILDETSEYCRYADLENVFVAANLELTQEAKEKDNPDRSLTRFEFMEVVIRIAINKYHRTNVCDSPAKAVDKLVLDNLLPNCPEDRNDFRSRFLYTEEISDIFSEHIVLLQDIYNSNMGRYCKPGEKKGMQLVEFLGVMERYQVYSDGFKIRDVKEPFLSCKLVVLDEMATVGHKKLFMTDFMELLVRVAALRYPPRPLTVQEVGKSLVKLFVNHFLKHEALLEQFRETVDQALAQQRIEEFAQAINAQKGKEKKGGKSRGAAGARKTSSGDALLEEDDEDESDDESSDEDDEIQEPVTNGGGQERAATPTSDAGAATQAETAALEVVVEPAIAPSSTTPEEAQPPSSTETVAITTEAASGE